MASPMMQRARRIANRLSSSAGSLTGFGSPAASASPIPADSAPGLTKRMSSDDSLRLLTHRTQADGSAVALSTAAAAAATAIAAQGFLCGRLCVEIVSIRAPLPPGVEVEDAPRLAVVLRPLPDARPKKARTSPRVPESPAKAGRLGAAAASANGGGTSGGGGGTSAVAPSYAWHERVEFELRRAGTLVFALREVGKNGQLGDTVARGELTLPGSRLRQPTPLTVDIPLSPRGELRIVLVYEDAAPLFGLDLATVCSRENEDVPSIVRKCCTAVEDYGLEREGIYRVPGNKPLIDALAQAFIDDAKGVTLSEADTLHINNVASLLKQYLQHLPEPVLTRAARPDFLAALELPDGPDKETRFVELLAGLPTPNRATSIFILAHLLQVTKRSAKNKMEPANLAICFGPTMLTSEDDSREAELTRLVATNRSSQPTTELLSNLRQPRSDNEVIRYILTHPAVVHRCQREMKMQSANTSMADLDGSGLMPRDGNSSAYDLAVEPQGHTLFQFQKLDKLQTGQLTCKALRVLCLEKGRLLGQREATAVFKELAGNLDGVSWPMFRDWWDAVAWQPLSREAQAALQKAELFFRHFADKKKRGCSKEASARMLDALLAANSCLQERGVAGWGLAADENEGSMTLDAYLRWLVQHDLL